MLVVRSPHHRAAFAFGDLDAYVADNAGIVAVFTAADIPGINRFGVIPPFADQPALAEGEARFRGEAVALVACEGWAARELDLAGLPGALDRTACRAGARRGAGRRCAPLSMPTGPATSWSRGFVERGDPDAALTDAAVIVSGRDRDLLCRACLYRAGSRLRLRWMATR